MSADTCKHGVKNINVCTDCLREKFGGREHSFAAPAGSADSSADTALRLARIVLQSTLYNECQEAKELTDLLLASGGHSVNWKQEWRSPPNSISNPQK